jgi:hypothetical protein
MDFSEEKLDFSRRSSQQTVAAGEPDCILTIGSQRLAAVLGDEWDNGMSVTVQGSPAFWVEDTGVLQAADVEIEVRVSNIVRLESEGEEDESISGAPTFRIGLVRLSQIAVKLRSESKAAAASAEKTNYQSQIYPRRRAFRASKRAVLAIALAATLFALPALAWHFRFRILNIGTGWPSAAKSDQDAVPLAKLDPTILKRPGVEPFLNAEVSNRLELTALQTRAFERLNKTTRQALEDLGKYWESAGRLELEGRRDVVLKAARQEGLQLLTENQRLKWEELNR